MENQETTDSLNSASRWMRQPRQRAEPAIASSIPDLVPRNGLGDGDALSIPDDGDFEVAPKMVRLEEMELSLYREIQDICRDNNITATAFVEALLIRVLDDDDALKESIELGKERRAIRVRRGQIRRLRAQAANLQAQMGNMQ